MLMRRRGMPLVRAAATTAVVAGTAGAVRHHQDQKYQDQALQDQAEADAAYQQRISAAQAASAPPPAASPELDVAKLKELGQLHDSGVLSDEEFASAKAKLLGG